MKKSDFFVLLNCMVLSVQATAQDKTHRIFDVQGHRGCRGIYPENSIPAFVHAVKIGVTTIELDVIISADGQVVVSHDTWVSPEICQLDGNDLDTTEKVNMFRLTYEEIKRYDCGSKFLKEFPEQTKIAVRKPLLREVINTCEALAEKLNRTGLQYNIEIKSRPDTDGKFHPHPEEYVEKVIEVIIKAGIKNRVFIQSFDPRVLKYVHKKYPEIRLGMLVAAGLLTENVYTTVAGFSPEVCSPHYSMLTAEKIKKFHKKGIKVVPWTVNDEELMKDLIKNGVDGIITDYPDILLKVLEENQ
jgi:glycerophosphoryl diester phosphodiesterase